MASIIKVDRIQSDTGTVNLASNLAFSSPLSMSGPVTLNSPTIATPTMTGQAVIPSINLTGGQIVFPATQIPSSNANTLDDYEEGTWTPSVTFDGGSTGITYSNRFGFYTKIGRQVFVQCTVSLSSKGSSTGTAQIEGLPFACNPTSNGGGSIVGYFQMASIAIPIAVINPTSTFIILRNGNATTDPLMTQANFNPGLLVIVAQYFV